MAATVKIDFVVGGVDAVGRAFRSIVQASQAAGKEQIKAARETSRAVAKAQNENANPKAAAAAYAAQVKEAKRAADKKIADSKRANDAIARESKRTLDKVAAAEASAARKKEASDEAAANRSVRRTIKEIEARETAEKRAERRKAAARQSQERRGQNLAYAMDFARIDDINRRRGSVRSAVGDAVKRGASSGLGVIQAGAGLVGGYLGTQTVLDAGRSQLDLGRRQALLQNTTGDTTTDFVGLSKSVSNATGESAGSVMGGLEKIAGKAGAEGIAQSKDQLLELAKVAKGAGVSMEDLGDVTATLINRGIKSQDLVKNIEALVQQGKDGAVEFKDLATMLDASSGALIKFKMDSTGRNMTAGGLSQIARTYGKSSAAESTNAVVDLARDLGGKADDVKKLSGVEVGVGGKVGRAQLRDVNTLLPEIIAGIVKKGNAGKLEGQGGIFTGNSTTISTPLMQAFTLGLKKNASGRLQIASEGETADMKGKDAVRALLSQFEDTLPKAGASVEAFERVMSTQSEQTGAAMNKLKNDLGEKLSPIIAKATPQIVKMVTAFGEITAWALSNPFKAVGAIMLASIAQSLASAGAASLFDKLLSKMIPSLAVTAGTVNIVGGAGAGSLAAGGSGGGLAARGVGMNAATILPTLAAGAVGYGVGTDVAASAGKDIAGMDTRGAALESYSLAGAINAGKGTPADRARAGVLLAKMKEEQGKGVVSRFGEGVTAGARGLMSGDVSVGNVASLVPPVALARGALSATLGNQQAKNDDTTRDAIRELQQALMKPPADEAVVAAINGLPAAMAAAGALQQPKVQP